MSFDNNNDLEQSLNEQRRKRAEQFKLNISDSDSSDSLSEDEDTESEVIHSYSGQDVKEQMAKDSKIALKQKKKEEKKERKAKNKRNRRIFRLTWMISILVVGTMASIFIIAGMNDLLAINRSDSSKVVVDIPENPSLDTVTDLLYKNGIIKEPSYFKMFANLTKSSDDFTQGTYEMRKNMDYEAIIDYLLSSGNRTDTVSVTITEGENVMEIANTLKKEGVLNDTKEFLELCNSNDFDSDFDFIKAIPENKEYYYKLEGYLYPDTYEFYRNDKPQSIIYKFLNNYDNRINEKRSIDGYKKKTTIQTLVEKSKTGYSLEQVMTLASIIQAEAANKHDMFNISSILYNRLTASSDKGVSNLGLDSTKFYPYRSAKTVPSSEKNFKSRYDTYSKEGLPPGPICNPGMDAIIAALNPNDTSYYFFCHDSSGQAYYAENLYQQEENLRYIKSYDN